MKKFRVECNFGCKYFNNAAEAFAYFEKCKKNRDVSIWSVCYDFKRNINRVSAIQELLDYAFTKFPK